jgi:hypothetical protein
MDGFFEGVQTPQSDRLSGTDLTIETILHGVGEYDDDMPEALIVTHYHGRSSIYLPVTEDGKVVDSKFFEFGSASPIERHANSIVRAATLLPALKSKRGRLAPSLSVVSSTASSRV